MATKKAAKKVLTRKMTSPSGIKSRNKTDNYMVDRLKEQRSVVDKLEAIHANPRLLREMAFYPAHDKRLETAAYKKAHDHLTKKLDLPCLVCGVKHSTLDQGPEPIRRKANGDTPSCH